MFFKNKQQKVIDALEREDVDAVKKLISPATVNDYLLDAGVTPLHICARLNNVEIMEALLQMGADVNKPREGSQNSPFLIAAFQDNAEVAACLLQHGADATTTRKGWTVMHVCVHRGHLRMVRCLLDHGIDPHITCETGQTALDLALARGHSSIAALLLQHVGHSSGAPTAPAFAATETLQNPSSPASPQTPQYTSAGGVAPAARHSSASSSQGSSERSEETGSASSPRPHCVCGVADVCSKVLQAEDGSSRLEGLAEALRAAGGVRDVMSEVSSARAGLSAAMEAVRCDTQSAAAAERRDSAYTSHADAARAALAYLSPGGGAEADEEGLAQASLAVSGPPGDDSDEADAGPRGAAAGGDAEAVAAAVEVAEAACAASDAALEAYACAWEAVGAAVRKRKPRDPDAVAQRVLAVGAACDALSAAHAEAAAQCEGLERVAAAAVHEGEARVRSARSAKALLERVVAEAAERPDKATLTQRLQDLSKQVVCAEDEVEDAERAAKRARRDGAPAAAGASDAVCEARRVLSRAQAALEKQEREVAEAAVRFYPELAVGESVREWGGLVCRRRLRDYTEREVLAQSRHAVWRARRPDGAMCVLKQFVTDKGGVARLLREARALQRLQHPCVAEVTCIFQDEAGWFMEMPYYSGGDLAASMRRAGKQAVLRMMHDAAQGLACIHRNGLVHCDVKPENVFIGADGRGRLGDFDVSKDTALRMATATVAPGAMTMAGPRGTRGYMAPEVVRGGAASCGSDVYSLGLMIYDVVATVDRGNGADGAVPAVSTDTVPADAVPLLKGMLAVCPEARPSAEVVVGHPLLVSGGHDGDSAAGTTTPVAWLNRHAHGDVVDVTGALRRVMQVMVNKSCDVSSLGQGRNNRKGEAHKGLRVERVLRVEHADLWEAYQLQRRQMQARAGTQANALVNPLCAVEGGGLGTELLSRNVNEVHLFHGTLRKWSDLIVSQGMDERVCMWGLHGAGLYFAENSSKSDEYMSPAEDGLCDLLVCRVLLGKPHLRSSKAGAAAQSARRPPCVEGHIGCTQGHASTDSVLAALEGNPREFVVYDRARVYPEYIVKVRRVEQMMCDLLS